MLNIESVNHVGIRVGDKARSVSFYADLGFELLQDAGFDKGHPVVMKHPSGVAVNLLGPATRCGHTADTADTADTAQYSPSSRSSKRALVQSVYVQAVALTFLNSS